MNLFAHHPIGCDFGDFEVLIKVLFSGLFPGRTVAEVPHNLQGDIDVNG